MKRLKIALIALVAIPVAFAVWKLLPGSHVLPNPAWLLVAYLVYKFVSAGTPKKNGTENSVLNQRHVVPAHYHTAMFEILENSRFYPRFDVEKLPHYNPGDYYILETDDAGDSLHVRLKPYAGRSGLELAKMGDAIAAAVGMGYAENTEATATHADFFLSHSAPEELDFTQTILYNEVSDEPVALKSIPLGRDKNGDVVTVPVFENHFLIGGSTGSGKSFAATNLFLGLGRLDNVVMYGIDAKGGIELAAWRPRFSSIAETREQALTMLKSVFDEMMRRNRRLKPQGKLKVDPNDPETPIIFVAIDEAAELLDGAKNKDEKEVQDELYSYLVSIAQLGRSAGIVLLVMTQSPYSNIIKSTLRNNLTVRFGLRTATEEQGVTILGERYETMPHHISANEKGAGVLMSPGYGDPIKVKTFFITEAERARSAKLLAAHKPSYMIPGVDQIVWTQWQEFVEAYVMDGELSTPDSQIIKKDPRNWSEMSDSGVKWLYQMVGGGGTIQGLVADLLPNGLDDVDKMIVGMEARGM